MSPPPSGTERHQMAKDEFMREVLGDIDPVKHAGEGFFATDEYARPADVSDQHLRGDILGEGEYYPPPTRKRHP